MSEHAPQYRYGLYLYASRLKSSLVTAVRVTAHAQAGYSFPNMEWVEDGEVGGLYIFFASQGAKDAAIRDMIRTLEKQLELEEETSRAYTYSRGELTMNNTERPDIPDRFHWDGTVQLALSDLDPDTAQDLLNKLEHGVQHWQEYKYLDARASDSKARFNTSMLQVLPFLNGKAAAAEGSFTLQFPPPRKTLDAEALKLWLVNAGVDADLVARGVEACTRAGKPGVEFVKFSPSRKRAK